MALGSYFSDFDPQRLQTHALAVTPDRTSGGAAVVRLDEGGSYETLALFRGTGELTRVTTTTTPPPSAADVTVDVYNGGAADGEARRVSWVLVDGGFGVGTVDTATEVAERTTVAHAPHGEAMAELVAAWLTPAPEIVEDRDLEPGRVRVTLGPDFDAISEPAPDAAGTAATEPTGVGPNSSDTAETTTTTTTTTVPGWTPGSAPQGVSCP
jgi:hypothetical protein